MSDKLVLEDVVNMDGEMIGMVRERIREGFSARLLHKGHAVSNVTIDLETFNEAIEAAAQRVVRVLAGVQTNVDADQMADVREALAKAGLPGIRHGGEAAGVALLTHEMRNHQQRVIAMEAKISAISTKPQKIGSALDLDWATAHRAIERMMTISRNVGFTAPELVDIHVGKCHEIAVLMDVIAGALKLSRPTGIEYSGIDIPELEAIHKALGIWASDYNEAPVEMVAKLRDGMLAEIERRRSAQDLARMRRS